MPGQVSFHRGGGPMTRRDALAGHVRHGGHHGHPATNFCSVVVIMLFLVIGRPTCTEFAAPGRCLPPWPPRCG